MSAKILLIGGEDIHLRIDMIGFLQKSGFQVAVAASVRHPVMVEHGVEVFLYDLHREIGLARDLKALRQLRRIVRDWKPDIVHAFDTKPTYLLPIALARDPSPRVLRTITGMGKIFSTGGLRARILRNIHWILHRIARKRSDHTVFQNRTDQRYFLENRLVSPKDISLIPGSGINLEGLQAFRDDAARDAMRATLELDDKIVFVMIARLVWEKGVMEYLQAARQVRKTYPDAMFLLVGPGASNEPGAVPDQVIGEFSDDVRYLGPRSDVPEILNASDVFVLPTKYREGVPRAMLEAMALSLPVVVSDMPGCREAVEGRGTGFLVPPGDVPALAGALEQALTADRRALGTAGMRDVRDIYALPRILSATLDLYGTMLK